MSKKYTRNPNSIYASFIRAYKNSVAEFATQITVRDTEEEGQPKRKGVRASLALGGIGAGYALGKNPEAQEVLRSTGVDLKDRAIDKALDFRTKYETMPSAAPYREIAKSIPTPKSLPTDNVAMPNFFGNYDKRLENASEAQQVANDLGLNPNRWFGGSN